MKLIFLILFLLVSITSPKVSAYQVYEIGRNYSIDPFALKAMAKIETNFNSKARSNYVVWYGNESQGDKIHGIKYGDKNYKGKIIDWSRYTCASHSFPQNTKLRIYYRGKFVDVIVKDKGGHRNPDKHHKPIIAELTPTAFKILTNGNLEIGKIRVKIIKLDKDKKRRLNRFPLDTRKSPFYLE